MSIKKADLVKILDDLKAKTEVQAYSINKEYGVFKVEVEPEAGVNANSVFTAILTALPKNDGGDTIDIVIKEPITKVKTTEVREMLNKFGGKK